MRARPEPHDDLADAIAARIERAVVHQHIVHGTIEAIAQLLPRVAAQHRGVAERILLRQEVARERATRPGRR